MVCDARRGFDSRPPSGRPDLVALRILPTETRDLFASKLAIASIPAGPGRGSHPSPQLAFLLSMQDSFHLVRPRRHPMIPIRVTHSPHLLLNQSFLSSPALLTTLESRTNISLPGPPSENKTNIQIPDGTSFQGLIPHPINPPHIRIQFTCSNSLIHSASNSIF